MTAQTNTVTPAQRFTTLNIIDALRKTRDADNIKIARVLDQCSYWESFPTSYKPEQVAAAIAVISHINERGSQAFRDAFATAAAFVEGNK